MSSINTEEKNAQQDGKDIKSMKLYCHMERVKNELNELGYTETSDFDVYRLHSFDTWHYLDAIKGAIEYLKPSGDSHILEVGSGLGGVARDVAVRTGCHVTAVELQSDVDECAQLLSRGCALLNKVHHVCADFITYQFDETFDGIMSVMVFCHVPDKAAAMRRCYELLKPGGKLYVEDLFLIGDLSDEKKRVLSSELFSSNLPTKDQYLNSTQQAGFCEIKIQDFTSMATEYVGDRLGSYRAAKARHVRVNGESTYTQLEHFYTCVDRLFRMGILGACYITATKLA